MCVSKLNRDNATEDLGARVDHRVRNVRLHQVSKQAKHWMRRVLERNGWEKRCGRETKIGQAGLVREAFLSREYSRGWEGKHLLSHGIGAA